MKNPIFAFPTGFISLTRILFRSFVHSIGVVSIKEPLIENAQVHYTQNQHILLPLYVEQINCSEKPSIVGQC